MKLKVVNLVWVIGLVALIGDAEAAIWDFDFNFTGYSKKTDMLIVSNKMYKVINNL